MATPLLIDTISMTYVGYTEARNGFLMNNYNAEEVRFLRDCSSKILNRTLGFEAEANREATLISSGSCGLPQSVMHTTTNRHTDR